MGRFLLRRLVMLVLTLFVVSVIAFLVPYAAPGDPALTILRSRVADLATDPDTVAALRAQYGLDRPLVVQYLSWLRGALSGDLGYSFTSGAPVAMEVGRSILVSLTLALSALTLALAVALPLGTLAAMKPSGRVDEIATLLTQVFVAVPEYWLAPMGILVFTLWLGWLPSAGWHSISSAVLPSLVLSLRPMAYFTRITRAAMIDVLQAPYITAARSRGLSLRETVLRHGIRNGAQPVVTLFALWLAGLLGGSLVIEVIFAIPGMGRLIYEGAVNTDMPMLQAAFIAIVALAVMINTLADLVYALLNPRVRYDRAGA
ncbi:MAG: ABC transporter permease [Hyphomicrobiaceae bacterium]|nr:MAG: ABC transporter permease [Hyphomicrobiaceae bacterium]